MCNCYDVKHYSDLIENTIRKDKKDGIKKGDKLVIAIPSCGLSAATKAKKAFEKHGFINILIKTVGPYLIYGKKYEMLTVTGQYNQ